jgi:hypothetical protein
MNFYDFNFLSELIFIQIAKMSEKREIKNYVEFNTTLINDFIVLSNELLIDRIMLKISQFSLSTFAKKNQQF